MIEIQNAKQLYDVIRSIIKRQIDFELIISKKNFANQLKNLNENFNDKHEIWIAKIAIILLRTCLTNRFDKCLTNK